MRRLVAATVAATVLLLTPPLRADPMPDEIVPEEAVWVVHADFRALRNSTVGQALLENWDQRLVSRQVQQISDIVGIDLVRDVLSATLYGEAASHDATAIVVTLLGGTGNLEGLMLAAPEYQTDEIDGRTIHSFLTETEDEFGERRLHVALQQGKRDNPSRVVAAHDPDVLGELLERVEGERIDTDGDDDGVFLIARLNEVDAEMLDDHGDHSAVIQMIEDLALQVGEEEGKVAAVLEANVVDEQRAEQVRQLVQGLLAMTQIGSHQNAQRTLIADLARQTVIERDDETVTVRLELDADAAYERLNVIPGIHAAD